jgi:hypothetical protein
MNNNCERIKATWGEQPPGWIDELAKQCDATSQSKVASQLRMSTATVSQVLAHKYPGRLDHVQAAVEGAYLNGCVDCPVLGDLPTNECLHHQRQPFRSSNSQSVRLFRACRDCPNNRLKGE